MHDMFCMSFDLNNEFVPEIKYIFFYDFNIPLRQGGASGLSLGNTALRDEFLILFLPGL